ncbi:MAG: hypothetical protein CVU62_04415 [Deltaproteobacteria bacterium HGW-Deltaproteobacteria-2]|jgi:glycosyltransferase involved in cell wall biosynthesis|nr:MAG: hypothetical protein CVU62_04415 [Deltaproteobacteria bacterium HGW-Deltaproteobacteria-2]
MNKIELSIIITVYSETWSLLETIARIKAIDHGYVKEIILTVSPRSSAECMESCDSLVKENSNIRKHVQEHTPGVGWALREAMEMITGTHVVLISADLETEPEAIERMVKKVEETGCDGVIGNRWLKGGGFQNYDPLKFILNWLFQKIFRVLYWTRLGDLTYGYKLLSSEICRSIVWEGTLHEINIETTVKPLKLGYRIEQVPTVWIGRKEGSSKNTFWRNFRYVNIAIKVWWCDAAKLRTFIHQHNSTT